MTSVVILLRTRRNKQKSFRAVVNISTINSYNKNRKRESAFHPTELVKVLSRVLMRWSLARTDIANVSMKVIIHARRRCTIDSDEHKKRTFSPEFSFAFIRWVKTRSIIIRRSCKTYSWRNFRKTRLYLRKTRDFFLAYLYILAEWKKFYLLNVTRQSIITFRIALNKGGGVIKSVLIWASHSFMADPLINI